MKLGSIIIGLISESIHQAAERNNNSRDGESTPVPQRHSPVMSIPSPASRMQGLQFTPTPSLQSLCIYSTTPQFPYSLATCGAEKEIPACCKSLFPRVPV